jgi:beta-galactosidase
MMKTAPGFEHLQWFGRGPHENYIDRNAGAWIGRFAGTVDQQYVPYILPQENGNKTDVRWFSLSDQEHTFVVTSDNVCEFSTHHFTPQALFDCLHTNEVEDVRCDETVVCLDHRQSGLGSGSCGPGTMEKYALPPRRYAFAYTMRIQ